MGGGGEHDGLFRVMVQHPGVRDALVRERLPPEVVAALSAEPPEVVDASFIDAELKGSQADALFRMRALTGQEVFVYCLVEHKSVPDWWVALQLLRYLERAWAKQRADSSRPLAPILPLVIYHGEQPWTAPRTFSGLLAGPAEAVGRSLDFHYEVLDVGKGDEATLSRNRELRALLRLLKYGTREFPNSDESLRVLVEVLRDLGAGPDFLFEVAVTYAWKRWPVDRPILRAALARAAPELEVKFMRIAHGAAYAEDLKEWRQAAIQEGLEEGRQKGLQEGRQKGLQEGQQQGRQEGRQEGRQKGLQEGRLDALRLVLKARFGPIPASSEERLAAATAEQIDQWLLAALEAESLEAVLRPADH